jgi:hypothetical protein
MLQRVTALGVMAEFGSTGKIGPLRCNASLTDIAAALAPSWDIGRISKRTRWPHLFSYGHVELRVCRTARFLLRGTPALDDGAVPCS